MNGEKPICIYFLVSGLTHNAKVRFHIWDINEARCNIGYLIIYETDYSNYLKTKNTFNKNYIIIGQLINLTVKISQSQKWHNWQFANVLFFNSQKSSFCDKTDLVPICLWYCILQAYNIYSSVIRSNTKILNCMDEYKLSRNRKNSHVK